MTHRKGAPVVGVGVDIGTTYSGAAIVWDSVNGLVGPLPVSSIGETGVDKFPSLVFVPSQMGGQWAVGKDALTAEALRTPGEVHGLFKKYLSGIEAYPASHGSVTAISLTTRLIHQIKASVDEYLRQRGLAGIDVRYAFSHPVQWRDLSRFRQAIHAAGISSFSVISEPEAAALGAAASPESAEMLRRSACIFVCDLGGGTLDFATVTTDNTGKVTPRMADYGDLEIGMANVDKAIALKVQRYYGIPLPSHAHRVLRDNIVVGERLEAGWNAVARAHLNGWASARLQEAETVKMQAFKAWDTQSLFPIVQQEFGASLTLSKESLRLVVDGMNKAIRDAAAAYFDELMREEHIGPDQVRHVVITGGGYFLPGIRATMRALFPHPDTKIVDVDASFARSLVQRGAALFAHDPTWLTNPRCNFTFGIERRVPEAEVDPALPKEKLRSEVIDGRLYYFVYHVLRRRNEALPLTPYRYTFAPSRRNTNHIDFLFLRSDQRIPSDQDIIGRIRLPLPPGSGPDHPVSLCVYIKADGKLYAFAEDPATNRRVNEICIDEH